jgi:zinc-ribbon domain
MYCNNCGSPVGADQVVCPRCGTSIIGARAAVTARTRVAGHVQLIAIFWFVTAVISGLIPMFVMLALSGTVGAILRHEEPIARLLAPGLFLLLAILFAVHTIAAFVTGWGLYKLRPWGRTLAIVMSFLALLHPPFGTALGIYTLVVLLPTAAGDEYRQMAEGADGRSNARAV